MDVALQDFLLQLERERDLLASGRDTPITIDDARSMLARLESSARSSDVQADGESGQVAGDASEACKQEHFNWMVEVHPQLAEALMLRGEIVSFADTIEARLEECIEGHCLKGEIRSTRLLAALTAAAKRDIVRDICSERGIYEFAKRLLDSSEVVARWRNELAHSTIGLDLEAMLEGFEELGEATRRYSIWRLSSRSSRIAEPVDLVGLRERHFRCRALLIQFLPLGIMHNLAGSGDDLLQALDLSTVSSFCA